MTTPLPESALRGLYTPDQMREYGAAVAAEKDALIEAQGHTLKKLSQEVLALSKERDTLRDQIHTCGPNCSKAGCLNRRLRDEVEQLRADAQRYRWFRHGNRLTVNCKSSVVMFGQNTERDYPGQIDAAIDAAMRVGADK